MTRSQPPIRNEITGWAAFLLFVWGVWTLRRRLDRWARREA
jgi:hypothetical protein